MQRSGQHVLEYSLCSMNKSIKLVGDEVSSSERNLSLKGLIRVRQFK